MRRDRAFLKDVQSVTGSVEVDQTLLEQRLHPNGNRWDYALGMPHTNASERVVWLEPHHAAGGETATVIRKLVWLKEWLRNEAPNLEKLPRSFVWLVTTKENPNDRRRRAAEAEKHGLRRAYPPVSIEKL